MYKFWQNCFRVIGFLGLIVTAVVVIWLLKMGILKDQTAFQAWIGQYQLLGPILFIGLQILQIVIPIIPGGVTTVAGFLMFGFWKGLLYNYIGIMIGSISLFLLVKRYGKPFILLFVKENEFLRYQAKLKSKRYEWFFIFCMASPISPADIMVMITGLTQMSLLRFSLILLVTKPFSIIGYSYLWIKGGDLVKFFLG